MQLRYLSSLLLFDAAVATATAMDPCDGAYTLLGLFLRSPSAASAFSDSVSGGCSGTQLLMVYLSRGTNALLWATLVAITLLLSRELARLVKLWVLGSRIAGPSSEGLFSFAGGRLGYIPACGSGESLTGYLGNLHEKYGPLVRVWLSPSQLLVSVKDTMLINEVLTKAEDKLPLTGRAFRLAFGRSTIFVSSFGKVQKRRESLEEYMNGRLIERTNVISAKVIECVMERIGTVMAKGILDCKSISQHLAFYILGNLMFGEAFLDWSKAASYEELLMTVAKDGCYWASYTVPPFWRKKYWKYKSLCSKLKCLTEDIIQHCRHNYHLLSQIDYTAYADNIDMKKETRSETSVLLDTMISGGLFQEEMEGHLFSDEELIANVLALMFHGCLASASLLGNILTRLVLQPELQEKLYAEIISVRGKKCESDLQEVQKMHLVLATVYESARLLPAGPLLQRCSLNHDISLKSGVTIPAGAILVIPLQLVQMDYSIWGKDAGHFNPHRFLSEPAVSLGASKASEDHAEKPFLNETRRKSAFLPFGSGSRACIGQKFGILGISAVIAYLLQNYEIRLQPQLDLEPKPTMNDCILQLLPSPKIHFVKRNK